MPELRLGGWSRVRLSGRVRAWHSRYHRQLRHSKSSVSPPSDQTSDRAQSGLHGLLDTLVATKPVATANPVCAADLWGASRTRSHGGPASSSSLHPFLDNTSIRSRPSCSTCATMSQGPRLGSRALCTIDLRGTWRSLLLVYFALTALTFDFALSLQALSRLRALLDMTPAASHGGVEALDHNFVPP